MSVSLTIGKMSTLGTIWGTATPPAPFQFLWNICLCLLTNFVQQHNLCYTRSCFRKCLSFQYELSKRLPDQSQQLKQSLEYVHS